MNDPNANHNEVHMFLHIESAANNVSLTKSNSYIEGYNEINSFTPDQLSVLRQIANERLELDPSRTIIENLHSRIIRLNTQDKTRKTIVIDSNVGAAFDAFSDRMKMNKSDLMALAMLDFMERYDVKE